MRFKFSYLYIQLFVKSDEKNDNFNMNIMKEIAKNLKRARLTKNMTQSEVAEKAGLSVNHYAKIERGEVTPGLDTFEAIVKAIGTKSTEILPF